MSSGPPPFASPMRPVAPPTKKIRAEGDGDAERVARRRELDRLRQEKQQRQGFMAKASAKLAGPPAGPPGVYTARPTGPSSTASRIPPPGATMGPPAGQPIGRARQSDIFPSVTEKVLASVPPVRAAPRSGQPEPVVRKLDFAQGKSPAAPAKGTTAPPPASATPAPAPVPSGKLRAKSAPPSRPPPPSSAPPPLTKEAPAKSSSSPPRGYNARPPPTNAMAAPPTNSASKATLAPAAKTATVPGSAPPKVAPAPAPFPVAAQMTDDSSSHHPSPIGWRATIEKRSPLPAKPTLVPQAAAAPTPNSGRSTFPAAMKEGLTSSKQPPITSTPVADGPHQTSSRKAMIETMRKAADTPKPTSKTPASSTQAPPMFSAATPAATPLNDGSNLLQMEKALREAEQSKADALRQIARLEEQVQGMKELSTSSSDLDQLVARAERDGEAAALQWAKAKLSGSATPAGLKTPKAPQVGFFPMSPGAGMPTPRALSHVRKRVATPHPKREGEDDGRDCNLFVDACKVASHKYESTLATFYVRRPFGVETDRGVWMDAGALNNKNYESQATISSPSSLEIAAEIHADGSWLMVYSDDCVRLRGPDIEADWQEIGSVEETNRPLGHVAYIDRDANEKEYSLDEVFEEARLCRETYCALVIGMAAGITSNSVRPQGNLPQEIPAVQMSASGEITKAPSTDACVGTDDIHFTPSPGAAAPPAGEASGSGAKPPNGGKAPPPPPEDEGGDIVTEIGRVAVTSFVSFLYFILVQVPFRIGFFAICAVVAAFFVIMIQIQLQDHAAAESMKAVMDFHYNQPGVM